MSINPASALNQLNKPYAQVLYPLCKIRSLGNSSLEIITLFNYFQTSWEKSVGLQRILKILCTEIQNKLKEPSFWPVCHLFTEFRLV
jgi:hypothetical protein